MTQFSPKTTEADLAARYWITPAGYAALARAQAQNPTDQHDEEHQ